MIDPGKVRKNFSRDPEYYHAHAKAQLTAARELSERLAPSLGRMDSGRVLEIGCGTGFLTAEMIKRYPHCSFVVSDISRKMLDYCENRTAFLRKRLDISVDFIELDANGGMPPGSFDLIVSSLTFQWVKDLPALLRKLRDSLTTSGTLAFSIQCAGTFSSFRTLLESNNIKYPSISLPEVKDLHDACGIFSKNSIAESVFEEDFTSLRDFMRHIQRTGAGNASATPTAPSEMRKLLKKGGGSMRAVYKICHVIVQK